MTQPLGNKIGLMTHISGDTSAFAYGSKYSLATPPYTLPHAISYFEYGYIQFTEIKEIPILVLVGHCGAWQSKLETDI